jgi:NAD(P)-dependent dehydrogenase (short-subunit alcohol dehydrogenase family)
MIPDRITTPFGPLSTAAEVVAGIDLAGKRAVVTGGSSGIGAETARALSSAGADVTLAVRDVQAGERTAADIAATTGTAAVHVHPIDLADAASVAAFVRSWRGPLHLLVNNAGVMALPRLELTQEGWETQFATNHLGHFALAVGLHDALAVDGARIVSVSSRAHLRSPVVFEDLHFNARAYDPWLAYAQAKTANVLFAVEATRRWSEDGIVANAVHPGPVVDTRLVRHIDTAVLKDFRASVLAGVRASGASGKTAAQGAATSILVAASPQLDKIGGRYFEDCNESIVVRSDFANSRSGVAIYAIDPESATRLWEQSERLLGSVAS